MKCEPVIQTIALSIGYLHKRKVQKIVHESLDLQLYPGQLTSLLGLNGAGKSTLLRTICGFQSAISGEIRLQGNLLSKYSAKDISRIIGVVLTEKTNAGGITVYELVSLGRHPYTGFFGQLSEQDKQIVEESIDAVGIGHKTDNYVSELSDGERQKAMIAKALAQQCPIIVLDEPTAFLDVTSRIETMVLLHRLATEQNKAILLSTHDLDLAIQMSDCLWLQERSRPIVCGTPEDLILTGEFESFFNKDNIVFDHATGKLKAIQPSVPVGVEGDFNTAYWVGNALIRNNYYLATVSPEYLHIDCIHKNKMIISTTKGKQIVVSTVADLIREVKDNY